MFDFQTWIERNFAKWRYRQLGLASLIVLAFVGAAHALAFYRDAGAPLVAGATEPVAVKRWLNRDDPRGFLPPAALGNPGADDGRFDIAWISGSPISIRKAPPEWRLLGKTGYEMTDVLARYLISLDGDPVRVQEYLLQGTRSGDMRRAVLFASQQPEIDAYLVEANSVWAANDFLQFTQSRQRALILGLPGATWFDNVVAAQLLKPSEIGLQLLSTILPMVRDRYRLFSGLSLGQAAPFPFTRTAAAAQDGGMLANWQSWFFPNLAGEPISAEAAALGPSRTSLLMSDVSDSGLGMQFFVENVKTLAATGKPVIVYLPPLNPLLKTDPVTVAFVERFTAALQSAFARVAGPNVEFHTETVWAEPQPSHYLDILHLDNGQGVIDMMVGLLEAKLGKTFERQSVPFVYQGQ